MQLYSPDLYGSVTLAGTLTFDPVTGTKIELYRDGPVGYGMAINSQEYVIYGDAGANFSVRFGLEGKDAAVALYLSMTGMVAPGGIVDTPIGQSSPRAGSFTDLSASGAVAGAGFTSFVNGILAAPPAIGATTPNTGRFTTLALTTSQTAKFVLAAPNAAAGAPSFRQLVASDISGLGTFATANLATPGEIGATTPGVGTFSGLAHTGFLRRSYQTNITASATNTQAGAFGLTASVSNITSSAANSAVRLPNGGPGATTAAEIIIRNGGAGAVNVWPPAGASINAQAANTSIALAAGASMRLFQLTATLYITV